MTDHLQVPVWTLATDPERVSRAAQLPVDHKGMNPERLAGLRQALAAFLDTPLVTVEAYPLPAEAHFRGGRLLDAASPLAVQLRNLLKVPANASTSTAGAAQSTETLYRMVVPRTVAAQLGEGLVRSMPSKAATGGIYSDILGKSGIVKKATFVPVVTDAPRSGGTAAMSGTAKAVTGAGMVTAAASFVLLAVATAASVYAEEQRRKAMERVTELLEELTADNLDAERDRLNGATTAVERATALLLDKGEAGHALGLDAAVHTVDTAIAAATRRAGTWRAKLAAFSSEGVEVADLVKAFPGIDQPNGAFRVELRLASLAIATKRRVAVLQAVQHAQKSPELDFHRFTAMLQDEQRSVDELQGELRALLVDLVELRLRAPTKSFTDRLLTQGEVNNLLAWPARLRQLAAEESVATSELPDVEIGLVQREDDKVLVLPAKALPRDHIA
ncbi:hypothetical protein [Micromonospora halophytica]|uniref:Uncharacterized protein n=1 Tax=Micromonospora halophytica TaxID=47864 RepID=A0A1C5JI10_9ACTN|nr:hypothetical protein [Micromonospora halophytica]SCG69666.1 hypothetical protein GA0070560_13139 [Micromonospora halophytica]